MTSVSCCLHTLNYRSHHLLLKDIARMVAEMPKLSPHPHFDDLCLADPHHAPVDDEATPPLCQLVVAPQCLVVGVQYLGKGYPPRDVCQASGDVFSKDGD